MERSNANSNLNHSFDQVWSWVTILGLSTGLIMASHGASASLRDRQTTEQLLSEDNTLEQSNFVSLLKMIEAGRSWDSMDPWMAYHNLERFRPYSNEVSNAILEVVLNAIKKNDQKMDIERLLLSFDEAPIRYPGMVEKLTMILRLLPASEAKRITAYLLTRFPEAREEAVESLRAMLTNSGVKPVVQVIAAFNLLSIDSHVAEAEEVLRQRLRDPGTTFAVKRIAEGRFSRYLSKKLATEIASYASDMDPPPRNPVTKNTECNEVLGSNVVIFRRSQSQR